MNNLKLQLQKRLIANVIINKCTINKKIIFRESWCSQDRIIRFTTPFLRSLFKTTESTNGYWKTGDMAMYEIYLSSDSFSVSCLVSKNINTTENKETFDALMHFPSFINVDSKLFSLRSWKTNVEDNIDTVFEKFDFFIEKEIVDFEENVADYIKDYKQEQYLEGAKESYYISRFERNPKAKAACLAHHGAACVICGIDFGKAYGPEFAGKIEVHHVIPVSQIGEEYVVNPINDLVPVCPNCHSAIHSKKEGVYSIEEMKNIRNNR